jgi:hypothetical protein
MLLDKFGVSEKHNLDGDIKSLMVNFIHNQAQLGVPAHDVVSESAKEYRPQPVGRDRDHAEDIEDILRDPSTFSPHNLLWLHTRAPTPQDMIKIF